jgi:hypothetical protein
MVCFRQKDLPAPVDCCSTVAVVRSAWQGHAPKNLNTLHFLMKRFNKFNKSI